GGRVDDDLLEASFQGPVLLDVLAVLVQGGGADALDLTPRQRWLEDVGGVDGALGPAGPDQGVQLVDEQDGIAGAADLVHDGLDAFLELSAVLGAGDHHGQIEHDDAAVPQQFGDIAADNHLGESLDDGGLAHAGLAQEHRVVLGAAGQHLDDALDLVGAADDGIEFALTRQFRQVTPEAVQSRRLRFPLRRLTLAARAFAAFIGFHVVPQQVQDFFPDVLESKPEVHEDLGGDALLLAQQPQEQVLGADVVVIEVAGLLDRILDHLLGSRRLRQLAGRPDLRARLDEFFGLQSYFAAADVEVFEDVGGDPGAFLDESEEDVFGADVLVVEALGFLVGQLHHLASPVREAFIHCLPSPTTPCRTSESTAAGASRESHGIIPIDVLRSGSLLCQAPLQRVETDSVENPLCG